MYEMPLIYGFGVLGLGRAFFVLGLWAMAFCHWRFVLRSLPPAYPLLKISISISVWGLSQNFPDVFRRLTVVSMEA